MKNAKNVTSMRNEKAFPDTKNLSICGVILCAGLGSRTGLSYNKMLHYVGKKTVLELTLDRFSESRVESIVLVVNPDDYDRVLQVTENYSGISVCLGGKTRGESVHAGLREVGRCDIVVIHDGARPYISKNLINLTIDSAIEHGSGILAVPTVDSVKEIKNDTIIRSLSRNGLYNIQTPQTFIFDRIIDAYDKLKIECTDCSEVYALAGYSPKIVLGDYDNIKLTSMHDFMRPATIKSHIGTGFDVHKLVNNLPLILGGVQIDYPKGLLGHSDADVLTHAIMDALLSAAKLPDIGVIFPDKNPVFKNANSIALLKEVHLMLTKRDFMIHNISAVVMAEAPRLSHIIPDICLSLANNLGLTPDRVNVSATTTEGLGIIGKGKGIAASATCLLIK